MAIGNMQEGKRMIKCLIALGSQCMSLLLLCIPQRSGPGAATLQQPHCTNLGGVQAVLWMLMRPCHPSAFRRRTKFPLTHQQKILWSHRSIATIHEKQLCPTCCDVEEAPVHRYKVMAGEPPAPKRICQVPSVSVLHDYPGLQQLPCLPAPDSTCC